MKKIVLLGLVLASCGSGDVYDTPIPTHEDSDAMLEIRDGLKPEDREAWQAISMALINPLSKGVQSATVGEAIERQKAKTACMAENDVKKAGEMPNDLGAPDYEERNAAHIEAYNKLVDGYNTCLKMVV